MKVQVTQSDINHGTVCDEEECPIALAIRRILGKDAAEHGIAVKGDSVLINFQRHSLPWSAIQFIQDFDSKSTEVKPFTFEIGYQELDNDFWGGGEPPYEQ